MHLLHNSNFDKGTSALEHSNELRGVWYKDLG